MDRQKLWRIVQANYEDCEENAPEGYEPRVRVYIAGRTAPVEIGQVSTQKDPEYPWVGLSAASAMRGADPEGDPEKTYPDDVLVFAREDTIIRVEIGFVRREPDAPPRRPIGFTIAEETDYDAEPGREQSGNRRRRQP